MNIDINKTYTTRSELPVVLFEVSDKVFGKYQRYGKWYAHEWSLDGGRYHLENEIDLIPAKTWRAWEGNEAPRFFIARRKTDGQLTVIESHGCVMRILFNHFQRVREDGSETPCGVEE